MSPSSETWVWLLRLNEGMTQAGIAWEDVMLPELKTQRWQQLQQRLARLEGESYREIVSLLSLVATGLKEELRTAWMPWFWETRWSEFRKPLLKAMAPHLKQSDWKDMLQRWDELGPAIRQSILGHLMEVPSGTRMAPAAHRANAIAGSRTLIHSTSAIGGASQPFDSGKGQSVARGADFFHG